MSAVATALALPAQKKPELISINAQGVAELNLHAGQAAVWESVARFVLMLSGSQGGKTSFGPWWIWRELQRLGQGDYLAATSSFDLFKLKMLPEIRKTFEEILGVGRYWSSMRVMEISDPVTGRFWAKSGDDPMWARIILRSAESPAGLESTSAKAAWLDEVGQDGWDVTVWEAILRRLALAEGRVLGTTTVYNSGWIKTEWYDRWAAGDDLYDVIQFDSTANPVFPRAEFKRAKRSMPEWRFNMFYRGRFGKPTGMIYKDFEDRHLVDRAGKLVNGLKLRPSWRVFVAVDYGGANNATLYIIEDPNPTPSKFYVVAEYLEGDLSSADHVANIRTRLVEIFGWVPDDLTVMGGSKSETQQRRDWAAAGLKVHEPDVSDVEAGISAVIELLKTDRLYFLRTLVGVIDEKNKYRRKIEPDGTVLETIMEKAKFHRLDALRYFAVFIKHHKIKKARSIGR